MSIFSTSQIAKYDELVASIRKISPIKTEFKLGQRVAYVNDYGVIFDDHIIIGFADDDLFYGKFIYLDIDSYWCPVAPDSLRVYDADGKFEIREGEIVAHKRPITVMKCNNETSGDKRRESYDAVLISNLTKSLGVNDHDATLILGIAKSLGIDVYSLLDQS